jgi:hypothetical protein
VLKPVVAKIGRAALRDLTAHDVGLALSSLARRQSGSTVAIAHNALTRAVGSRLRLIGRGFAPAPSRDWRVLGGRGAGL